MNALQPLAAEPVGPLEAAVEVRREAHLRTPLVFASPHSGRIYPEALHAASRLDAHELRRSEDAFVDELIEGALARGAAVVLCRYARAFVDVNRDPWELDPAMFEDELPDATRRQSPRVAAGLGAIPRLVGEGREIYSRKLAFSEASERIEAVHRPYHAALGELLQEARQRFGAAILIDWHSMPSAVARSETRLGRMRPDVVLGDRHGAACAKAVSSLRAARLRGGGLCDGVERALCRRLDHPDLGPPARGPARAADRARPRPLSRRGAGRSRPRASRASSATWSA